VIRHAGGVAFVLRRASGIAMFVYFVAWLARLHEHPLVPFGGDLARGGTTWGKVLELALIFLVAAHALDGLSQIAVERRGLMHRRGYLVAVALVMAGLIALFHFTLFFGGASP
jgi:succinate dehydrogenase hydrophobic anchor subunit